MLLLTLTRKDSVGTSHTLCFEKTIYKISELQDKNP